MTSFICHCERSAAISLLSVRQPWKGEISSCLCLVKAPCGGCEPAKQSHPSVIASVARQSHPSCHCERSAAISLFFVCWLRKSEIASYLAMTKRRAQRGNLSFRCLPALKRRDHFMPRDDIFYLSLRAQRGNLSFICTPALERRDRFMPRDDIFYLSLRAQRGNLSFICLPALERRDRFVPRDDIFHLSLRACEAISLFSVCWLWKGEIASFLAMTKRRAKRGNLSFICLLALERRDRFMPRDDIFYLSLRAQRGNLSFRCLPALKRRDRFVPRDPYCHCEPAKQSLFYLFAGCGKARSLRSSR